MPQISATDVGKELQRYGVVNPTPAEENLFAGMDVIGGAADAAIAEYANYKLQEQQRQASDPLAAYQTLEQNFANDTYAKAQNLYSQLSDLQSSAPQLFGALTPDQIQQYLAPLATSFKSSLAEVQGSLASRGLGASSTEANALAQTNQQFQENVLSTGLQVGMTQQQNKAQSIQAQINNLLGLSTQAQGQVGAAVSQKSQQDLGQSNLIASLPYFLRSSGTEEANAKIAADQANQGGFLSKLQYASDIFSTGKNLASSIVSTPKDLISASGVSPTGSPTSIPMGFQGSPLNVPGYDASRFQNTGSLFE